MFDLVLGFEVRAGRIVRANGLDKAKPPFLKEGYERRHLRMQAMKIIQTDGGLFRGSGPGDRESRALAVVSIIATGDEHIQRIGPAAKEDADQSFSARIIDGGALGENQLPKEPATGRAGIAH